MAQLLIMYVSEKGANSCFIDWLEKSHFSFETDKFHDQTCASLILMIV